jgi:hypothetical protein
MSAQILQNFPFFCILKLTCTKCNHLNERNFFCNIRGCTESHEQLFFACELGTADEGEYGGRWNQLLCYP